MPEMPFTLLEHATKARQVSQRTEGAWYVIIIPVPGIILWIMFISGLTVALVCALICRFAGGGRVVRVLRDCGMGVGLISGFGLLLGKIFA